MLPASACCYLGAALSCTLDGMLALGNSERLIRPDQASAPIRAMPGHTPLAKIGDYWRACDYQDLRGDFKALRSITIPCRGLKGQIMPDKLLRFADSSSALWHPLTLQESPSRSQVSKSILSSKSWVCCMARGCSWPCSALLPVVCNCVQAGASASRPAGGP